MDIYKISDITIINLEKSPLIASIMDNQQMSGKTFYIRHKKDIHFQLAIPLVNLLNYAERLVVGTSTGVISFFLILNDQGNIDLTKSKYEEGKRKEEILLSFLQKDYEKPLITLMFKKKGKIKAKILDNSDSGSDSDD